MNAHEVAICGDLDLDLLIRTSLSDFANDLHEHEWHGRENELVNLFVFGHLLRLGCPPKGRLDPTQIGIEVAVPQLLVRKPGAKKAVRKDLVIWRLPRTTFWSKSPDGDECPMLAVMEWKSLNNVGAKENKHRKQEIFTKHDIDWLQCSTRQHPGMIGYAVFVDLASPRRMIKCHRVFDGESSCWFEIPIDRLT